MKHCNACNTTKNTTEFYIKRSSSGGLMSKCKECSKAAKRKWAKENRELLREYDKKYYEREDRKEYMKAYLSNHMKENKAQWNARSAKRRASKLQRTPEWLTDDHLWMIEEVYELAQLRSKVTGVDHHVDHVVPLRGKTVSGLHVPWNLQVIPWYENLSKSNGLYAFLFP
jgi:hypothetical protein